ncbi:ABC transporter permease [Fischerella muscicola CCMEE 5323]|uniref:ABC transporter permease n=1 Tax=Fischerella muscicola CCMEE 5323 TaxID=2019572 RepID=A0A2N6K7S9_FISMU|nr:ABC transporter permease subunit [Fischerella muscicola]PLZ93494.1 ABC transporter permease [Fischerella muscicola CCMEE 5323]
MMLNFMDKIGDWNPQLLREIKGRLKVFPVAIACITSLVGQLILFLYQLREIPGEKYQMSGNYCRIGETYKQQINEIYPQINKLQQQLSVLGKSKNYDASAIQSLTQQIDQLKTQERNINNILYNQYCPLNQIDMQGWWRDHWEYIFLSLTVIFVFTLLVAGTYLLINNLAQEENRGTLNFLRLSPQSETTILTGKMLGVPILIYLAVAVAIPFHLLSGRAANIAFSHILSFYVILAASCFFFYSTALLFGFLSRFFSGFQPWLGSGTVLIFLFVTMQFVSSGPHLDHAAAWLRLFSPFDMTAYLFPNLFRRYNWQLLEQIQFFYLPVGKSLIGLLVLNLVNYGLWSYWVWHGLKRRFRNPNSTMLSKGQSYLLVTYLQLLLWGFTLQYAKNYYPFYPSGTSAPAYSDLNYQVTQNFAYIMFFNLLLLFGLIAILSPHRQAVQDWARYRHQNISRRKGLWQNYLLQDLIWGEKSPALITLAINLVIVTIPLVIWILVALSLKTNNNNSLDWLVNEVGRFRAILGVVLFICMMMIYATITQIMLMMKNSKRSVWAIGTVAAAMFLPPTFLGMLNLHPEAYSTLWLLSSFPWAGLEYATTTTVFVALLGELAVLVLLNLRLKRQIKIAGESATKALLATS